MDRQITPAFSGFWYRVTSLLGWFRASLASLHVVRISLFLLKTNDALFPAPDRFPQVSFRLRPVSFGHDHHVLRTRNRGVSYCVNEHYPLTKQTRKGFLRKRNLSPKVRARRQGARLEGRQLDTDSPAQERWRVVVNTEV